MRARTDVEPPLERFRPRERAVLSRYAYALAAGLVAVCAIFAAYWNIGTQPALYDEDTYVTMGWRYVHWWSIPAREKINSNFEHPPLGKYVFGLAQLLAGHPSLTASRVAAATCGLISAVIVGLWVARVLGRWTGLLASALVALIPTPIFPQTTAFPRAAMLDTVAATCMLASVAAAWFWLHDRSWRWCVATGVLVGLSAATKENAWLAIIGPVLLGLAMRVRDRQGVVCVGYQVMVAAVVAVTTFCLTYMPIGVNPLAKVQFLVSYQHQQQLLGHVIGYAGRVDAHPAWWANFWFAWHSLGPLLTLALVLLAAVALKAVPCSIPRWCVASLTFPVLAHCFVFGNTLSYYWAMWLSPVLCMAAVGLAWAVGSLRVPSWRPAWVWTAAGVSLFCAVLLAAVGGGLMATVRANEAGGAELARALRAGNIRGPVLASGVYQAEITVFTGPTPALVSSLPPDLGRLDAVIIGKPRCRTIVDPAVSALVDTNLGSGALRPVYDDRLFTLYRVTGTLQAPTAAQVAAVPDRKLADDC